jgi:hypothetical protein
MCSGEKEIRVAVGGDYWIQGENNCCVWFWNVDEAKRMRNSFIRKLQDRKRLVYLDRE